MAGRSKATISRIAQALPVIFGVILVSFLLTRALPGDPAVYFAGQSATAESIQEVREALGLDKSLSQQFIIYLGELFQGDLGSSLSTGQPVLEDLARRLPASLELTLTALILACSIAVPLGVMAANKPNSLQDHLCRIVVTAGVSLPTFFTGILLIYVFYYLLGIAPSPLGRLGFLYLEPPRVTGFYLIDTLLIGDLETFMGALKQLILPAITLALFTMAPIARMTRAAMLSALSSDFIRTAKAVGLTNRTIMYKYAFKNALLPVVTTLGMVFSFMLGANVLVEKVFAWPGIGSYAIDALVASDYAAVQGFVLTMAILFVMLNLIIDISYSFIDPRIGFEAQ